jgi:hypothetical protein
MEDGVVGPVDGGAPQGGPLSPIRIGNELSCTGRVSTDGQTLDSQIAALKAAGAGIYRETASGAAWLLSATPAYAGNARDFRKYLSHRITD